MWNPTELINTNDDVLSNVRAFLLDINNDWIGKK